MNTDEINNYKNNLIEIENLEKSIYNLHLKNIFILKNILERITKQQIDFIFNDKSNIYIFEDNTNITKYKFLYLVNYDSWTLYKDNRIICNNKIFEDMVLIYLNIFKNISNLSIVPYPNPYIKTKVIKFTNKFNKCNKNNILKKKNILNNTNDDIDFINDSLNKLSFNNENNDIDVINDNLNKLSFNNNNNNNEYNYD